MIDYLKAFYEIFKYVILAFVVAYGAVITVLLIANFMCKSCG